MYEAYPRNTNDSREVLVVLHKAAQGLLACADAINRGVVEPTVFEENIIDYDPFLHDVMEHIIEGWEFDDEQAEQFKDGFSVTYTALLYGAELRDMELPEVDELIANGYISGLVQLGESGSEYCTQKAKEQTASNGELTNAWIDYSMRKYGELPGCFTIGGVIAHDIIANQINMNYTVRNHATALN